MAEMANDDVRGYFLNQEKDSVRSVFTVMGFNFGGRAQNGGFAVVDLKDFDQRPDATQSAQQVTQRALAHFSNYKGAIITPFLPPAVRGLGNATGFDFELEDRGHLGRQALVAARNQLLKLATADPDLVAVRPNGLEDAPQARLEIDREKAWAMGVSMADINTTVQGSFGSLYVNEFTREGRTKRVFIEGTPASRMTTDDLRKWYVRNNLGDMVRLSSFVHATWGIGGQNLERYNGVESLEILGQPAPGVSTGQAMAIMQKYAATLPKGIGYQWTSVSFEQQQSAGQAGSLYLISIIVVLLCLAALYESWSIPTAVLLIVPLGALGAAAGSLMRGLDNDIYFQVGLLTTVGLATKNAILIVEFAKARFEKGSTLSDAAVIAARESLRPILMTSFAFIFGRLPLAVGTGAGARGHIAIGVAGVSGMIWATIFAIYFVPGFFVAV